MMTFRNSRLRDFCVPMSTNWLLNDLAETNGKQKLFTRPSPQWLKALRKMALVRQAVTLEQLCPGTSRDQLGRLLKERKSARQVTCLGRCPGAKWRQQNVGHNPKRGSEKGA